LAGLTCVRDFAAYFFVKTYLHIIDSYCRSEWVAHDSAVRVRLTTGAAEAHTSASAANGDAVDVVVTYQNTHHPFFAVLKHKLYFIH